MTVHLFRGTCAVVLLAAGLAGFVPLCVQARSHPSPPGLLTAAGFLQQGAFLALGSHLFHAPLETARPLRCGSFFLLGYLTSGFGLFNALVMTDIGNFFGECRFDAVTQPSRMKDWFGWPILLRVSFADGFGAVVFAIVPFLLPKPGRRDLAAALTCFGLGLAIRPHVYAALLDS